MILDTTFVVDLLRGKYNAASKLKPVMESLHSSGMILKSSSDLIQLTQTGPEGVISAVRRL